MGRYRGPGGVGGGGGGGLHFRDPADTFTGATLTAARTARDTYFGNTGNAADLAQFQGDRTLAIILQVTGATTRDFETYLGNPGDAYDNTQWVPRTDAVQGNDGDDGRQGRFEIAIHTNSTSQPTPDTPTGGSYNIVTGVLTPPTGTTEHPTPPGTGEDVWISEATINPALQSGSVTPTWSEWVERAHLSQGISHVEHSAEFGGLGTTASPLTLDPSITRDTELGGLVEDVTGSDFEVTVTKQDGSASTFLIPDDLVDVTNTGLPALDADNHKKLFIDHDTPRIWVGHREVIPGTPAAGTFNRFQAGLFEGERTTDPPRPTADNGQYYYNTIGHAWYRAFFEPFTPGRWRQTSFRGIFGSTSDWLGEQADDVTAANLIQNYDNNRNYYYYNTGTGHVERLNHSTYVAPVSPVDHYVAEPISAPTGVGSIAGVTAGDGLAGGGTSGVVTLGLDTSLATFPTIPIDKGGTGATTAVDARIALQLGTAAIRDTGTSGNTVPILGVGGVLPTGVLAAGGTADQVLTRTALGMAWRDAQGGGGTGDDAFDWATVGNTDLIPNAKLAPSGTIGQVLTRIATGQEWADPTGMGGPGDITGVAAGDGLSGGGDSGDVTLNIDVSDVDFPTIPIGRGGTGSTTASTARTALGLGTAAVLNAGAQDGELAILQAGGVWASERLAAGGTVGQVLARTSAGQTWVSPQSGPQGAQGEYEAPIYRAGSTLPSTPTGGSITVDTGSVFAPPGWTVAVPALSPGENLYRTIARINPLTDMGVITPTWDPPYIFAPSGSVGPQAAFNINIYQNADSAPGTPSGGTYALATGVLTPPTGWTTAPTTPGGTQSTFTAVSMINPAVQSGTITPVWSAPFPAGAMGAGDITAVTAGAGITGGGTVGAVTIAMDVTKADFPDIPINRGGTGATTAADARTNLGLGTAGVRNTGTDPDEVPILNSQGEVPISVIPGSIARDSEVADSFTGVAFSSDVITLSRRSGSSPATIDLSGLGGGGDDAYDWATEGNFDRMPDSKLDSDTHIGGDLSGSTLRFVRAGGGTLDIPILSAIQGAVSDWAEDGNVDIIPAAKLSSGGAVDTVLTRTSSGQVWAVPQGGLTTSQVDARVRSGVEDWAETGSATLIPGAKLDSSITRDSEVAGAITTLAFDNASKQLQITTVDGTNTGRVGITLARFVGSDPSGSQTYRTGDYVIFADILYIYTGSMDLTLTASPAGNSNFATYGGQAVGILRFGSGAPANSLGNNGDRYFATSTQAFYTKASGTWTIQHTITSGAGGLTMAQVEAIVASDVSDWAIATNTDTLPFEKMWGNLVYDIIVSDNLLTWRTLPSGNQIQRAFTEFLYPISASNVTGTANAPRLESTLSFPGGFTEPHNGTICTWTPIFNNTGPVEVTFTGSVGFPLHVDALRKVDFTGQTVEVEADDLIAGEPALIQYNSDDNHWYLLSFRPNPPFFPKEVPLARGVLSGSLPAGVATRLNGATQHGALAYGVDAADPAHLWKLDPDDWSASTDLGALPTGNDAVHALFSWRGGLYGLQDDGSSTALILINPLDPDDTAGDFGVVGTLDSTITQVRGAFVRNDEVFLLDRAIGLVRINPLLPGEAPTATTALPSGLGSVAAATLHGGFAYALNTAANTVWRLNTAAATPNAATSESEVFGSLGNLTNVPTSTSVSAMLDFADCIFLFHERDAYVFSTTGLETMVRIGSGGGGSGDDAFPWATEGNTSVIPNAKISGGVVYRPTGTNISGITVTFDVADGGNFSHGDMLAFQATAGMVALSVLVIDIDGLNDPEELRDVSGNTLSGSDLVAGQWYVAQYTTHNFQLLSPHRDVGSAPGTFRRAPDTTYSTGVIRFQSITDALATESVVLFRVPSSIGTDSSQTVDLLSGGVTRQLLGFSGNTRLNEDDLIGSADYLAYIVDDSTARVVAQVGGSGSGTGDDAFAWATEGNSDTIPAAKFSAGRSIYAIPDGNVGGSGNAITVTTGESLSSLPDGMVIMFRAEANNSGTTSVNVDGTGAESIRHPNSVLIGSGDIVVNDLIILRQRASGGWTLHPTTEVDSVDLGISGQDLTVRIGRSHGNDLTDTVTLPAGSGTGDDAFPWATEGNTDVIPIAKLAAGGSASQVLTWGASGQMWADAPGGGSGDDAFDWATEGNSDTIPDAKLASGIARGTGQYYAVGTVGGTGNAITLTTGQSLSAYVNGMLFAFNSTAANTGAATANIDGIGARNIQRSRRRDTGDTGSEPLEANDISNNDPILLLYGSQFNEFYLLPARAGVAAYYNVGTDELDLPVLGAGGLLPPGVLASGGTAAQVLTRTATGQEWADAAGGGTGDDAFDWATEGNTDRIPDGKIPTGVARLDDPDLTGTPTAPTPPTNDDSTRIATTAFVQAQPVPAADGVADSVDLSESGGDLSIRIGRTGGLGDLTDSVAIPSTSGGLTESQVDARVRVGVSDWAETGNTDRIPEAKINGGTVHRATSATISTNTVTFGLLSGQTVASDDLMIFDAPTGINAITANLLFDVTGLNDPEDLVDADSNRIQGDDLVEGRRYLIHYIGSRWQMVGPHESGSGDDAATWAEEGNTDVIPVSKVPDPGFYRINPANVGGTANLVTLTTGRSLASIPDKATFVYGQEGTNTGAMSINVDGVGALGLVKSDGVSNVVPMEAGDLVNGSVTQVVYLAGVSLFAVVASHWGSAGSHNVGTDENDVPVLGSGGVVAPGVLAAAGAIGEVLTRTATGQSWQAVSGMGVGTLTIQDDGTQEAAGSGLTLNFGPGIDVAVAGNVATITLSGGGTPTHTDQYLTTNTSATTVTEAEFTGGAGIAFNSGQDTTTVPGTTQNAYLWIARLMADPDLVFFDINNSGINQIGAITKQAATVTIGTATYELWRSNQTGTWGGLMITAR